MKWPAILCWGLLSMLSGMAMAESETPQSLQLNERDFDELSELMRLLRRDRQERLFIPVAKLQLAYLTDAANVVKETNPELAHSMLLTARGVAFNIASFTWPGWGDAPEPISDQKQALGLLAALRGVEIAESIDAVTPNIMWILGVHQLNAGKFEEALASLERGKALARNEFFRDMHRAWQDLVRLVDDTTQANRASFEAQLAKLREGDEEDAEFYVEQLETARSIYLN